MSIIKFNPRKPLIEVVSFDWLNLDQCGQVLASGCSGTSVYYEMDKDFIELLRRKKPFKIIK